MLWPFVSVRPSVVSSVYTTRVHGPCSWAVFTGRFTGREHSPWTRASFWTPMFTACEHGCQKMAPVFTGLVGHQCSTGVNAAVFTDARKWRPC